MTEGHLLCTVDGESTEHTQAPHGFFEVHGVDSALRSEQSLGWPINITTFIKPEGSLSCSQEHAPGPCSKKDVSSQYHHILFL
jgi:hypothetical protein